VLKLFSFAEPKDHANNLPSELRTCKERQMQIAEKVLSFILENFDSQMKERILIKHRFRS